MATDDFEQADTEANAALEYARSLPPGTTRSQAFKEAGRLRSAADRLRPQALRPAVAGLNNQGALTHGSSPSNYRTADRTAAEREGQMSNNDAPPPRAGPHVNFDAPAILRKWPSLNGRRRSDCAGPYLLVDGTLGECIHEFMTKPVPARHLYEIHTSPQPPLVAAVLSDDIVAELRHLREFL